MAADGMLYDEALSYGGVYGQEVYVSRSFSVQCAFLLKDLTWHQGKLLPNSQPRQLCLYTA